MIFLNANWSAIDKEIDRIEDMPDFKTKALLDAVLETGFKSVQTATHVITGSLKSSEKMSSEEEGDDWIGTISAGGPSAGVNNPVDYAIYEKARGEDHDFFFPLAATHPLFVAAVKKGLSK